MLFVFYGCSNRTPFNLRFQLSHLHQVSCPLTTLVIFPLRYHQAVGRTPYLNKHFIDGIALARKQKPKTKLDNPNNKCGYTGHFYRGKLPFYHGKPGKLHLVM